MTTSSNSTDLNKSAPMTPDQVTSGYAEPAKSLDPITPAAPAEPVLDAFGYEVKAEEKVVEEKVEEKKVEEPVVEDKTTGYSDDPEKKVEPKVEEKVEEKKPVEGEKTAEELRITEINDTLGDRDDKESIAKFAVENNMTKDQVTAYMTMRDAEDAQWDADDKAAAQAQRSAWKKELLDDPTFGGDNFDINVDKVDKVLNNLMPNTKKVLTERGNMLPPYIMRDLLEVSKALNPTTTLVNGDPSEPVAKEEGNFLDSMYT